jgi:hypothetical protein
VRWDAGMYIYFENGKMRLKCIQNNGMKTNTSYCCAILDPVEA